MKWWMGVVIGGSLCCLLNGVIEFSLASQTTVARSRALSKNGSTAAQSRVQGKKKAPAVRSHTQNKSKAPAVRSRTQGKKKTPAARTHALGKSKDKPRQQKIQRSGKRQSASVKTAAKGANRRSVSPQAKKRAGNLRSRQVKSQPPLQRPEPEPVRDFVATLLADAATGQILHSENIDRQWPTASLTKMMVGLLAMEAIERKQLSLQTPVVISRQASSARGRTIHLRRGEVLSFGELLRAMLVTSANDAAVAVAERMYGSVGTCIARMNQKAWALGMHQTQFQTVNGMPVSGGRSGDISSARDMAVLGRELMKYHRVVGWTSLGYAPFRDGLVMLPNTNRLVGKVDGVNGLKTGFTAKARYNLVATAQRGGRTLIVVVLGGRNSRIRFATAEEILEWGFSHYARSSLNQNGDSGRHLPQLLRPVSSVP